MNSNSPELGVVRNYIELMLSLPLEESTKENKDLKLARKRLDVIHHGLDKVKDRIIEYLAVKELSDMLSKYGTVKVYSKEHQYKVTGSINKNQTVEMLIILKVKESSK